MRASLEEEDNKIAGGAGSEESVGEDCCSDPLRIKSFAIVSPQI